jgi:hypothetical protein
MKSWAKTEYFKGNDMSKSIMTEVQSKLHAPKGQTNKFGGYKYRSCEDIVEAVKPVLAEHDCYLNITDEMVMLGDRFYVKATASVMKGDASVAKSSAYARESLSRKGMDDSQLTGSTSSYARKYALNGLFAIDDTKDADTMDNRIDNTVVPRQDYIDKAYALYCKEVENEVYEESGDFIKVQQANHYLTNDERIAVMDKFGTETVPNSKKMLKTVAKDLLNKKDE